MCDRQVGDFRWLAGWLLVPLLAGCVDPYGRPNYTGGGALIGGGTGALLGAALNSRHPGTGALIGGAAGALTGGLIGAGMDADARRPIYYTPPPSPPVYVVSTPPPPPAPVVVAPPPAGPPPTVFEVQMMCRSGVSPDVILHQIQATQGVYHLAAFEIIDLKNAGASEAVINLMIATGSDQVAPQAPPPPPTEVLVVAPGPGYAWCPGELTWNGAGWVWLPGRWLVPPQPGVVWIEAHWTRGERGWHHSPGRWR